MVLVVRAAKTSLEAVSAVQAAPAAPELEFVLVLALEMEEMKVDGAKKWRRKPVYIQREQRESTALAIVCARPTSHHRFRPCF
jgi:hypothetical protein